MRVAVRTFHRRLSLTLASSVCAGYTALLAAGAGAQTTCPSSASVVVVVNNLSADASVTLDVAGELRDPTRTCDGAGATSYATTLVCSGTGTVRCGTITGLRPGAWINRVTLTVVGSAPQAQAQQAVVIAGPAASVSNVLTWTVYPATFVVQTATESDFRAQLDAAQAYTATHAGPALITFSRAAFPGANAPQTIDLGERSVCPADGRLAAICLTGAHVIIDALDDAAEAGAVVLSVGSRALALLRIYGSDDVLRGLVLNGSTVAGLPTQADTVAFVGAGALRDRLERSIVHGPTNGDATSAQAGGGPLVAAADANLVDQCELTGAEDRGLKVTTGAHVLVRESCIHDNHNGGIQSTLGGHVVALENLIQRNVPGPSDNGLSAGTAGDSGERSTLAASGNIVRFSGNRGVSVVDNADAVLSDDYVADNQFAGARIETLVVGAPAATAMVTGVTLACNGQSGISGACTPAPGAGPLFCTADADCCGTSAGCCVLDTGCADPVRCAAATPLGFGAVVDACAGCAPPVVSLGTITAPGRNALTANANVFPNARGTNLSIAVPDLALAARGNQWEHCGTSASCDIAAVAAADVQLAAGASADIAGAAAPRADVPSPRALSLGRPRAGDLVRVFGSGFNAIDGIDCAQTTTPVAACSAENPRVAQQNRSDRNGNRLHLFIAGQTVPIDIDAVTPTMLAFRMPVDCFAPATLVASKRNADDVLVTDTIGVCDARGCLNQPDGTACEDGVFCTMDDACASDRCVGVRRDCSGVARDQCHAGFCNETAQTCAEFVKPDGSPCDDGDACTTGDTCVGGVCQGGPPRACDPVLGCDAQTGCIVHGRPDCRTPVVSRRAPLLLRDQADDRRDALVWQWTAGTATTKAEFGDPLTSTDYVLRIYDTSGAVVFAARVPAGGACGTRKPKPCWKETTSGFSYENTALTPNGILRLVLHAGDDKKARIGVQGRGPLLALPRLPLAPPVTVQLERVDGACWAAEYDHSIGKNDTGTLKGRGD